MAEDSLFVPRDGTVDSAACTTNRVRRRRRRPETERPSFEYASPEEEGLYIKAAPYDPGLNELRNSLAQICHQVEELVPKTASRKSVFGHLLRSAAATANSPSKRKRLIHLVGDSGSGKSSTINCVLGMPDLAMAFGLGESVTRVATSYEAPFKTQSRRFAARIVCLSLNEVRVKLRALYRDYRSFQLELTETLETSRAKAASSVTKAHSNDVASENEAFDAYNTKRQASQSAFEVFCSLFCQQTEFKNAEAAKTFLESPASASEDKIISTFVKWCTALLPKHTESPQTKKKAGPGDKIPVSFFEADTQEELQTQLKSYCASNEASGHPSLWPLVTKIHIGIQNVPVLEHAIFVDWPGAGDTNDLRARASTNRVSDCDEIWIVCHISRACTNRTVFDALHRYAANKACSIVCTHLDTNADDPGDLRELQARGFQDVEYFMQLEQRKTLIADISDREQDLHEHRAALLTGHILDDGLKHKGTPEQLQSAANENRCDETELIELKAILATADTRIMNLGWDIHKPYYQQQLETALRGYGLQANLFFISNEHYMGCKGVKQVKGGLLDLARTGIPDLRRHILEITAGDEMAAFHEYITDVKTFLLGIDVLANPAYLKQNREVLLTVEKAKGRISNRKHGLYLADLDSAVEDTLQQPVERQLNTLVATATKVAKDKGDWHASTLKAFIANACFHETKAARRQNWNQAFFTAFVDNLAANWKAFTDAEAEAFASLETALLRDIEGVIADVNKRGAKRRLGDKNGEFRELIKAKTKAVQRLCTKARREYATKLLSSKTEATKPGNNVQKSFIDKSMDDGYDLCKMVIGTGYRRNIINLLEGHFAAKGNSNPFMSVVFDLKTTIEADANAQIEPLIEAVEGIFDDITGWLEGVFAERAGDADALKTRKALKEYLSTALKTHEGIKNQLQEVVREYERDGYESVE